MKLRFPAWLFGGSGYAAAAFVCQVCLCKTGWTRLLHSAAFLFHDSYLPGTLNSRQFFAAAVVSLGCATVLSAVGDRSSTAVMATMASTLLWLKDKPEEASVISSQFLQVFQFCFWGIHAVWQNEDCGENQQLCRELCISGSICQAHACMLCLLAYTFSSSVLFSHLSCQSKTIGYLHPLYKI